jgi:MYXO-CTERM domain-containing protein
MIATLQSMPSLWMLALVVLVLLVPSLWFLDAFGDKSQKTNSTTSLYENSFNTSSSEIQSLDGSTNVTLGGGESSSSGTSSIVIVAFAAVLVLGGLFLLLRRK